MWPYEPHFRMESDVPRGVNDNDVATREYRGTRQRRRPSALKPLRIPNYQQTVIRPLSAKISVPFQGGSVHPGDLMIIDSDMEQWTPSILFSGHSESTSIFSPEPKTGNLDDPMSAMAFSPSALDLCAAESKSSIMFASPTSADIYGWNEVLEVKLQAEELVSKAAEDLPGIDRDRRHVRGKKSLLHRVLNVQPRHH